MNRQIRMIKTTIIYFIGNFSSKILVFFLLPLYTTYLTAEDFGNVDIFISTLPLITPIFTMQVTESIFRFLCLKKTHIDKKKVITNSVFIFLIGSIIFISLYIPFVLLTNIRYPFLFCIYFFTTNLSIFLQQILRGMKYSTHYAIMGVMSTFIYVVLNSILIIKYNLGGKSLMISASIASLAIVILISLYLKIWKFIDLKLISMEKIKEQLKYGVPLIPNQICWWVISLFGKYILIYFSNERNNGILAVATKFPGLLTTINSIFFLAWTENIIDEFKSKDRDEYFSDSFQRFIIFTFTIAACLLPIIKIYNFLTISGQFLNSWKYIVVLYIGAIFNGFSSFLGTIYTASMKTIDAFTTTVIAAITNIIFSIILTPFLLIWGVVIANMISFIVFFVLRLVSVKKIINIKINILKLIPSIVLFFTSILVYYLLKINFQAIFLVFFVICLFWINRSIFIGILKAFRIIK